MTASKKYVALGSSTGGLYVFDRKTRKHVRFISNKVSKSTYCTILTGKITNHVMLNFRTFH